MSLHQITNILSGEIEAWRHEKEGLSQEIKSLLEDTQILQREVQFYRKEATISGREKALLTQHIAFIEGRLRKHEYFIIVVIFLFFFVYSFFISIV